MRRRPPSLVKAARLGKNAPPEWYLRRREDGWNSRFSIDGPSVSRFRVPLDAARPVTIRPQAFYSLVLARWGVGGERSGGGVGGKDRRHVILLDHHQPSDPGLWTVCPCDPFSPQHLDVPIDGDPMDSERLLESASRTSRDDARSDGSCGKTLREGDDGGRPGPERGTRKRVRIRVRECHATFYKGMSLSLVNPQWVDVLRY